MGKNGQALLIAILLVLFLVLSVPILVFVTRMGGIHQMGSQRRSKAEPIAQEGINYSVQLLSSTWTNALKATFPPLVCNTGTPFQAGNIGAFQLVCKSSGPADATHDPRVRPYQVGVTASAWLYNESSSSGPFRTMEAFLSQKTLVAMTGEGQSASAALVLTNPPVTLAPAIADPLIVHWGPIVLYSSYAWVLVGDANTTGLNTIDPDGVVGVKFPGFPRKFSQGAITGATFMRVPVASNTITTDRREYWAYASLDNAPPIDDDAISGLPYSYYVMRATSTIGLSHASITGGSGCIECLANASTCGCIDGGGGAVTFNSFNTTNRGAVIYVRNAPGGVTINTLALNLSSGAFIVDGNLNLGTPGPGLPVFNLYVSSTAPKEYPYWPETAVTQWPCRDKVGQFPPSCASNTADLFRAANNVNFYGFLHVKGNLTVQLPNWNLLGGVVVGDINDTGNGILTINSGASMTLVYDDMVVQNVHTQDVSLKIDYEKFIQ